MESRLNPWLLILVGAALIAMTSCGSSKSSPPPPKPCQVSATPPSGLEVLYGVAYSALLNYFEVASIDPTTGALNVLPGPDTFVPFSTDGLVAVHAQFLYISGPVGTGPGGAAAIFGFALDQTTGAPTSLPGSPFPLPQGDFPRGMATLPNSYLLYVADANRIDVFAVDGKTGVPTPIPGSPFTSGTNTQLAADPSGKFLYASDDDPPGGVLAFTVSPNGALTSVPGSPFTVPGQTVANSLPYTIVDTGKFVYTALTASNSIAAFSIDSKTGALAPVPGSPFAAGTQPGVLALANNFLYAANEKDGSISGYSIDTDTGALTQVPGSPFTLNGVTLTADLSGRYLYVSELAGDQGYNIDANTGALCVGAGMLQGIDGPLWLTVAEFPSSGGQ